MVRTGQYILYPKNDQGRAILTEDILLETFTKSFYIGLANFKFLSFSKEKMHMHSPGDELNFRVAIKPSRWDNYNYLTHIYKHILMKSHDCLIIFNSLHLTPIFLSFLKDPSLDSVKVSILISSQFYTI